MDFGALVSTFGLSGAMLAAAVIAFYFEGVVSGATHRRLMADQEREHERELTTVKQFYDSRVADYARLLAERTTESQEWRDLYRRVLSNLERNTNVTETAVAVARTAAEAQPPV